LEEKKKRDFGEEAEVTWRAVALVKKEVQER